MLWLLNKRYPLRKILLLNSRRWRKSWCSYQLRKKAVSRKNFHYRKITSAVYYWIRTAAFGFQIVPSVSRNISDIVKASNMELDESLRDGICAPMSTLPLIARRRYLRSFEGTMRANKSNKILHFEFFNVFMCSRVSYCIERWHERVL